MLIQQMWFRLKRHWAHLLRIVHSALQLLDLLLSTWLTNKQHANNDARVAKTMFLYDMKTSHLTEG
jgi:hypothetical protein